MAWEGLFEVGVAEAASVSAPPQPPPSQKALHQVPLLLDSLTVRHSGLTSSL